MGSHLNKMLRAAALWLNMLVFMHKLLDEND